MITVISTLASVGISCLGALQRLCEVEQTEEIPRLIFHVEVRLVIRRHAPKMKYMANASAIIAHVAQQKILVVPFSGSQNIVIFSCLRNAEPVETTMGFIPRVSKCPISAMPRSCSSLKMTSDPADQED